MRCKLCLVEARLCRSHIVPEFLHRELYDEKHRARQLFAGGRTGPSTVQKGRREELLCAACEQLLNDQYEKPFNAAWQEGKLVPHRLMRDDIHFVGGVDYATIKLFLLSVLFRAGVSTLGSFEAVKLGTHEERLRRMILDRDPGRPDEYPIVGHFVVDEVGTILHSVGSPVGYRLFGHRAYAFMFGGCEWLYFVSSHPVANAKGVGIRPDGVACFGAMSLAETRTMKAMREMNALATGKRTAAAR